jgi:cytoskeletal protein RodZ
MPASIGQQLQHARQARGLSIEEAAQSTRIRPHYLKALEADDASSLPSFVHGRGFLRNYAGFLGLDFAKLTGEAVRPAVPEPAAPPEPLTPEIEQPAGVGVTAVTAPPAPAAPVHAAKRIKSASKPVVAVAPKTGESKPLSPQTAEIFKEIGSQLREQRERLSLPLSDIERYTHIRLHYLKALEDGDYDLLPSFTQGRGMLHQYAQFLSLDTSRILNRFADALIARRAEITAGEPQPRTAPLQAAGKLHRFLTMDALVGSGLVILLVIFVFWGASRVFDLTGNSGPEPTPPSVAEVLLASPDAAANPILEPSLAATGEGTPAAGEETMVPPTAPAAEAVLPPLEPGKVQVFVVGLSRTWIRVDVDGKLAFTGRVSPGGAYPFTADRQVELTAANAAAVRIYLNQQDLGSPGSWNQAVTLVYTAEGAQLPTPTVTPTPTRTPRVSPTPTATRTPGGG